MNAVNMASTILRIRRLRAESRREIRSIARWRAWWVANTAAEHRDRERAAADDVVLEPQVHVRGAIEDRVGRGGQHDGHQDEHERHLLADPDQVVELADAGRERTVIGKRHRRVRVGARRLSVVGLRRIVRAGI